MDIHVDLKNLPREIAVRRRGRAFWPIFIAAVVCPSAIYLAGFAIYKGIVDGWKIVPIAAFAVAIIYLAFSQIVSIWWCSSNYLNFDSDGFRWGRLPLLPWEHVDRVGWIGGAKGVYNLILDGAEAQAWLGEAPLSVRIVSRIAFASLNRRKASLWVPLCADWQTVDPKVVIRAASQFKAEKSGSSTVTPPP